HRRLRPHLEHVVVDLERDHAGDHEVDLLLAGVAMAVAAATPGPRQHPAPAERDLFGRQRARVPPLFAVARVVRHEVERVLAARDGVGIVSGVGHLLLRSPQPYARTSGRATSRPDRRVADAHSRCSPLAPRPAVAVSAPSVPAAEPRSRVTRWGSTPRTR